MRCSSFDCNAHRLLTSRTVPSARHPKASSTIPKSTPIDSSSSPSSAGPSLRFTPLARSSKSWATSATSKPKRARSSRTATSRPKTSASPSSSAFLLSLGRFPNARSSLARTSGLTAFSPSTRKRPRTSTMLYTSASSMTERATLKSASTSLTSRTLSSPTRHSIEKRGRGRRRSISFSGRTRCCRLVCRRSCAV